MHELDRQHTYTFAFGCILLSMFLIYVYVCDHKIQIDNDDDWTNAFVRAGLPQNALPFITHDSDVWYYYGRSTCVAFGDFSDNCDYRQAVCAEGDPPNTTFGSRDAQVKAVMIAIVAGGEHPWCPLIYPGAA